MDIATYRISLHAVIFMLRKVESTSDVNHGPEPCQSGTAFTFQAYTPVVSQIDGAVRAYAHAHAHDDHYLAFNSLLAEMITPQTYKYISNSYITGARDVWHLLHRTPRALCPRVEGNKCHASRVRMI